MLIDLSIRPRFDELDRLSIRWRRSLDLCILCIAFRLLQPLQPNDREVLDQPLLDLLEPEVVLVELLARVREERAVLQLVERDARLRRVRRGRPRD